MNAHKVYKYSQPTDFTNESLLDGNNFHFRLIHCVNHKSRGFFLRLYCVKMSWEDGISACLLFADSFVVYRRRLWFLLSRDSFFSSNLSTACRRQRSKMTKSLQERDKNEVWTCMLLVLHASWIFIHARHHQNILKIIFQQDSRNLTSCRSTFDC